jgi:hypothetical protein
LAITLTLNIKAKIEDNFKNFAKNERFLSNKNDMNPKNTGINHAEIPNIPRRCRAKKIPNFPSKGEASTGG